MKAFILAIIAAIGLGVVAMYALTSNQTFAYQAFATSGARVSEPGTNLVGEKWNGDPQTNDTGESAHGKATGEPSHPKRS
ncbi:MULTISPECIES: hypothetical protein [unclassified Methylobacterium]|jgi:hypothetical protein|uniref:hypothetical protein n=1 Tax=unclassified Methylobacterium TaxID=2615210 RepID=UPI0006F3C48C|nr:MULTISPECIES: hypothetical protein [unclassified Methylobacterium]KQO67018.1 hypothetical protein ASF18_09945 [Methylobacterium sp. Leaf89]KQO74418.1 hypothetical protein ASF20_03925 [Methylobacterium sp. Leaf88]KQP76621.1 hypothetical protein ASF41_02265 [Methylobacterium sp. Leaf111]KQT69434.1 hypothetical protein ASG51_15115 [Methylobacterium sp. Leaf465]KQU21314.1 hypothetical protein ASG63_06900 [Methylobacterium sp. Leaf94]